MCHKPHVSTEKPNPLYENIFMCSQPKLTHTLTNADGDLDRYTNIYIYIYIYDIGAQNGLPENNETNGCHWGAT